MLYSVVVVYSQTKVLCCVVLAVDLYLQYTGGINPLIQLPASKHCIILILKVAQKEENIVKLPLWKFEY